jgi:hypothetical protein
MAARPVAALSEMDAPAPSKSIVAPMAQLAFQFIMASCLRGATFGHCRLCEVNEQLTRYACNFCAISANVLPVNARAF